MMDKPILCLDFDGVIHRYSKGWQDGTIYDPITNGFSDWAIEATKLFKLVVYSSRSKTPEGIREMMNWFKDQLSWMHCTDDGLDKDDEIYMRFLEAATASVLVLYFAHEKPPAFLTIDDRCIRFTGVWGTMLEPEHLRQFKPWIMEDNNAERIESTE
jgi:hypothetical protein